MAAEHTPERSLNPLMAPRPRRDYNDTERWFSRVLQSRLQDVLEAKRNRLEVLRRYPAEPGRLGVMATPADLPRARLRPPVVEELVCQTLDFIRSDESSGPVSQSVAPDGSIVEVQAFPTKFPHIIIERVDHYVGDDPNPVEISWSLLRVQNQRQQTQVNRLIDAAGLVFDLLKVVG